MLKVAVLDDFQDAARRFGPWDRLAGRAEVTVFADHLTGDALAGRLHPFEVLVAMRERTPFRKDLLDRLPNLKLLVTTGMRNLGIDVAECRRRGIPVCGTGTAGDPTAELAFGLILALSRNMLAEDRSLRAGTWETQRLGGVVRGKTLGLVGLGKLGAAVAAMGRAFGMVPVAWSPNLTAERAAAGGAEGVGKHELFARADFISVHLVSSERTRGVVDAAAIGAMKPGAFLVNTSRAALLDEAALVTALTEGRIAGAGLDVFNQEPLPPDAPILSAPNTILTPHLGYATAENYAVYYRDAVEDIEAWMAGVSVRVLGQD